MSAELGPIKFGTDGWRAVVAREYTHKNVARCAAGLASVAISTGVADKGIVVGYDTRFQSRDFAQTSAEMIASYGIDVHLFDRPGPTPSCSFFTRELGAAFGNMITASHNPPEWNGFKIKAANSSSAPPDTVAAVEQAIMNPLPKADKPGQIKLFNPMPGYLKQLTSIPDIESIKNSDITVVIDSMHGSGANLLRPLLDGGSAKVIEIRNTVNPSFPGMKQPEPIAENLQPLMDAVREHKADVGIAFDGDADRLGVVNEHGEFMSTGEVYTMLAHGMLDGRGMTGKLVSTLTISAMLDKLLKHYPGTSLERTSIGFKHLAPIFVRDNCVVAGEESGGYAFRGHILDRDGIMSALMFLEHLVRKGKRPQEFLNELFELLGPHAYYRSDLYLNPKNRDSVNARIKSANPQELAGVQVANIDRMDGIKISMQDGSWVASRVSGTEPLVRAYAEASDKAQAEALVSATQELLDIR